jgi:hypothetical protein
MIRPRFDIIVIDLESTALLLVEYYNILRLLNDIRANSKIHTEKKCSRKDETKMVKLRLREVV